MEAGEDGYFAERSVVGVVGLFHREGGDMAGEALRRWLAQPGRSPAQLIELARAAAAGGASRSGIRWRGC